ncbi:MAG: ATP-binding protein [Caldisericota bacterium]|nr:ATP-binding protein [Caldisericota bacterium]
MKIIKYKYSDIDKPGWSFDEVRFGDVNLLVGLSASGKTRLLNTIFNLGAFTVRQNFFKHGHWNLEFEQEDKKYNWEIITKRISSTASLIAKETLYENSKLIIKRDEDKFIFKDKEIPKLPLQQTSIFLLKEMECIMPIYDGFSSIMRREFFGNTLKEQAENRLITQEVSEEFKVAADQGKQYFLSKLYKPGLPVSARLYFLEKHFKEEYKIITDYLKSIFPFIEDVLFLEITEFKPNFPIKGKMPIFCIKEKHVNKQIPYEELSSGMQKVILFLTDIKTFPKGSIYLIDEYENSLGINAINIFPSFLSEVEQDIQFFITSHHPYLINNIGVKNWYILHRKGSNVKFLYGEKNIERFGKSKQKAFVQLLNDSFYREGIE